MDNILIVSDFPDIQYKKDSGTPAFRLIVEALSKKHKLHIIAPEGNDQSHDNIIYHRIPNVRALNGASRLVTNINKKLFWFIFTRKAYEIALELNKKYAFKLVYGAGCNSVYTAYHIGEYFCIPSVGRLFGTYLYPFLHHPLSLLLRCEEVLAFKSRCTVFIITNDGTGGDEVAKYFGISDKKLFFWRNGVERPLDRTDYSDDRIKVISMARLEKWKRIDKIITAFSKSILYNDKLVLSIVGGGPEEENLKQLVKDYGIESKVIFHEEVSRDKALALLTQSDIFISTNDYSNISNSLMEAMSAGKGIVVSDSGQTSSMINNTNGLVTKDDKELSNAIMQLCNKEVRSYFGYRARLYAAENFESWDSRIRKEVAICEGLIGRRS